MSDVMNAAKEGNISFFRCLGRTCVYNLDPEGKSALMWACIKGHLDVAMFLLEPRYGIQETMVGRRCKDGYTALLYAAEYGHRDIVNLLVQKSALVNIQTNAGFTPLLCAVRRGHLPVVKVLLQASADINMGPWLVLHSSSARRRHLQMNSPLVITDFAPISAELVASFSLVRAQVAGVQACRAWMTQRDTLQAKYDAAESELQYAECAKLWKAITSHQALYDSLVPNVEEYRTLADRHNLVMAAVEAKCVVLLAADNFTALASCSTMLSTLQGLTVREFPVEAPLQSRVSPSTSSLFPLQFIRIATGTTPLARLTKHYQALLAKQERLLQRHKVILDQHKGLATQANGVSAREAWMKRKSDLQTMLDAARPAKQFAECARLGQSLATLETDACKLKLSAEDYRTLGERHAQLVNQLEQLNTEYVQGAGLVQQALLDLEGGRRELLAVKDFAGLDAMAQLLTELHKLNFGTRSPLPSISLPTLLTAAVLEPTQLPLVRAKPDLPPSHPAVPGHDSVKLAPMGTVASSNDAVMLPITTYPPVTKCLFGLGAVTQLFKLSCSQSVGLLPAARRDAVPETTTPTTHPSPRSVADSPIADSPIAAVHRDGPLLAVKLPLIAVTSTAVAGRTADPVLMVISDPKLPQA